MKMRKQVRTACPAGRCIFYPGKERMLRFPPSGRPARLRERQRFLSRKNHGIMGSRGEIPALLRPGKDLSMMSAQRRNLFRQGGMRSEFYTDQGKAKK